MKISLQILIYLVITLISIVIITTSPIFGRLIILAFTFLYAIPTLVKEILEIKKNIDN